MTQIANFGQKLEQTSTRRFQFAKTVDLASILCNVAHDLPSPKVAKNFVGWTWLMASDRTLGGKLTKVQDINTIIKRSASCEKVVKHMREEAHFFLHEQDKVPTIDDPLLFSSSPYQLPVTRL